MNEPRPEDNVIPVMTEPAQDLFQTAGNHVYLAIGQLACFEALYPKADDPRLDKLHTRLCDAIGLIASLRDDVLPGTESEG